MKGGAYRLLFLAAIRFVLFAGVATPSAEEERARPLGLEASGDQPSKKDTEEPLLPEGLVETDRPRFARPS